MLCAPSPIILNQAPRFTCVWCWRCLWVAELHDQEFTLKHLVEIWRQSTLEEAEEPEPEPKKRTIMMWKLTQGLGQIETPTGCFEDIDSNQQQAAITRQEIWGYFLVMGRFWRGKESFSWQTSVLDFLSHLQWPMHHHLYCWTLEMMIQMTYLQFKRRCLLLKLSFVIFFLNFS
jgi:hypothetical protein